MSFQAAIYNEKFDDQKIVSRNYINKSEREICELPLHRPNEHKNLGQLVSTSGTDLVFCKYETH